MAIAVIMNDYFHDVATATLLASGLLTLALQARAQAAGPERAAAFLRAYPSLRRFAFFAVAWLVVGGIPRAVYWRRFEWTQAVANDAVPGLELKMVLIALGIVVGVLAWFLAERRTRSLRAEVAREA